MKGKWTCTLLNANTIATMTEARVNWRAVFLFKYTPIQLPFRVLPEHVNAGEEWEYDCKTSLFSIHTLSKSLNGA